MEIVPQLSNRLTPQQFERIPRRTKYVSQVQIVHDVQQMKLVDTRDQHKSFQDITQNDQQNSPKFGKAQANDSVNNQVIIKDQNYKENGIQTNKNPQSGRSLSPHKKVIRITFKPEKITYYRNGTEIQMDAQFGTELNHRDRSAQPTRFIQHQDLKQAAKPSLSPNKTSYWLRGVQLPKSPAILSRVAPAPFSCLDRSGSPQARTKSPKPTPQPSPVAQAAVQQPIKLPPPVFESKFLKRSASRRLKRSNFAANDETWAGHSPTPPHCLDSSLLQDPLTKKIAAAVLRAAAQTHRN